MKELNMFDDSITVLGYEIEPSTWATSYKEQYPDNVILIQDTRDKNTRQYIPSIRSHLLSKYCGCKLKNHNWMFHDSDILFTKKVDWDSIVKDPTKVYLSDTVGYIGANYIQSKGDGLLDEMCAVVGVDRNLVVTNEYNSGGAQYIFGKDCQITKAFWKKVERDSVGLYALMNNTAHKYTPEHPIQSWTADMWSLLWNIWKSGFETKVVSAMSFTWANNPIKEISTYNIFHNAGVTGTEPDLFFKGAFRTNDPFEVDFSYVNKEKCSYRYVQEIKKVSRSLNKH